MTATFQRLSDEAIAAVIGGLDPLERIRIHSYMKFAYKKYGDLDRAIEESRRYINHDGTPYYTDEMIQYMIDNWGKVTY